MKKLITPLAISAALLFTSQNISAQNVGINTTQPDASAALDIVGTDKGLLIPRVSLQSLIDNTTIPNPATALLIYNTNEAIGKAGFYYNSGTSQSPIWSPIGDLALPYAKTGNGPGAAFFIENTNDAATSSGITGNSVSAIGVRGVSQTGRGIVGSAISTGTGVFPSSANASGKALEVSGPITIVGPGQSPGNGKVLMSDANGNASWQNITGDVAFRASGVQGGGSEIIAGNGVPVKVAFNSQNYDIGNHYGDVNASPHSTFIVPVTGLYNFESQITFHYPVNESYRHGILLILTRNNTQSIIAKSEREGIGMSACFTSTDLQLQQGDQIHIEAYLYSGGQSGSIGISSQESFFNGRLIFKM
ncbi:hypothetical protein LXM25_22925 [Dyadobacter sp. LJ53]|uniref:C1q-like domain-containing protein n=1 Tax=Dyadobacter chenwenxiniae TaxID=2906456 RepID=UPI001F23DE96|nr:hypothetical protein [Dyadobacter chenwenxiniae]MCF0052940.1 hypothetical protein [Dyadobacter chenwenxiniae]